MIIAGDKITELQFQFALQPFWANLITTTAILLVVLLVLAALIFMFWDRTKRIKNGRFSKGKVLLEIVPATGCGRAKRILCEQFKGEAKTVTTQSRATFTTNMYARMPEGEKNEKAIDSYFLLPEHDYLDVWPDSFFKSQQVVVPKYYFVENDPCPKMPHDPSKWDTERYVRLTSAMARLSREESALQIMVNDLAGAFNNLVEIMNKLRLINFVLIGLVVLLFIELINVYFSWNINTGMGAIVKFLLGATTGAPGAK